MYQVGAGLEQADRVGGLLLVDGGEVGEVVEGVSVVGLACEHLLVNDGRFAEAAREVEDVLSALGLKAVIIGGIAVFRWGEPRATRDVDFTVLCPFGDEESKVGAILSRLRGRIDDARAFALANRVLLLSASNGRPVDIALGALAFEARAVARGTMFEFAPGVAVRTCSAHTTLFPTRTS